MSMRLVRGLRHKAGVPSPQLPRMGLMSAFVKNGVQLRCVEFNPAVEAALKAAGLTGGKEY